MLEIIENRMEKVSAQERFNKLMEQAWRRRENRRIIWRPDSRQLDIAHNRKFWFVSVPPEHDQTTKRYWNSFGVYAPTGGLVITVEINVATESNVKNVSGFFARDPATGTVYLMHDGGVGGGRKGVGRRAFLAWSSLKLVPTVNSVGDVRLGIVVGPLVNGRLDVPVSSFVNKVVKFKQDVRAGIVPTGSIARKIEDSYDDYYREFSGKKQGRRTREIEYISRHGDVVDELTRWRRAAQNKGERIVKNAYIDLGIEANGKLKVLFEVKTSTSRQNLYAAIGQLLVHGRERENLERYIVVPVDEGIPDDVGAALSALDINVLRYKLAGACVVITQR